MKLICGEDLRAGDAVFLDENGKVMRLSGESGKPGVAVAKRDYAKGVILAESATPRADAAALKYDEMWQDGVNVEFCREIELELAESEKRSGEWEALFHKFGKLLNERTSERDALRAR